MLLGGAMNRSYGLTVHIAMVRCVVFEDSMFFSAHSQAVMALLWLRLRSL